MGRPNPILTSGAAFHSLVQARLVNGAANLTAVWQFVGIIDRWFEDHPDTQLMTARNDDATWRLAVGDDVLSLPPTRGRKIITITATRVSDGDGPYWTMPEAELPG